VTLCCGDVTRYIRVVPQGSPPDTWVVEIDATAVALRLHADTDPSSLVLEADGVRRRVRWVKGGGTVHLHALGRVLVFEEQDRAVRARPDEVTSGGRITAPIGGRVVALNVEVGDLMEAGRLVAVIEAMKMEHRVTATGVGRVEAVHVAAGDQVAARQAMVTLSVEASEPGNEG
jgi:geranyl-CoA carboxylase alpha subunit